MVYVDDVQIPFRGMKMCHMLADSLEELHGMAAKIGLSRKWFQETNVPHYDLSMSKRYLAIDNGAQLVDADKVAELIAAFRKSKAEK